MSCDLKTLLSGACSNDFLQLANSDPKLTKAVILQLLCNISGGGTGLNLQTKTVSLDGTTLEYSVAHGLGATPKIVRAVFVAVAVDANLNYPIGTEIDLGQTIVNLIGSPIAAQTTQSYCDQTNLYLLIPAAFVGFESQWLLARKATGNLISPQSFNNFKLKFYYA